GMACSYGDSRLWTWQVLLTISVVLIPLSAHGKDHRMHTQNGVTPRQFSFTESSTVRLGFATRMTRWIAFQLVICFELTGRHSLARRHHHRNQSSVNHEALNIRMVLSDDSAERDHLIEAGNPTFPKHHRSHKRVHLEPDPAQEELTAGGAGPDQPGNPLSDDIITVEFHSPAPEMIPSDIDRNGAKLPKPQKQKGGNPTAWTLSDFYDYLSPDDDLSASAPTQEPEASPSPPADMEDENPLLAGPEPAGNNGDLSLGGAVGSDGCRLGFVRSGPGICVSQCDIEPNFCYNEGVCTVVAGVGAFCRCNVQDYIWNKGTRCDWAITEFQVMSAVVGVASVALLLLFMIVVFFAKRLHRLKSENKRLRKRSKYRPQSTEPQTDGLSISTTADGSQPNVRKLSLLLRVLLKTKSTSQQDDPKKQEDPTKSPPAKEEGAMNILNSHSPKHENNRPNSVVHDHSRSPNNTDDNAEVNVLHNNLV
uniref:Chondroitin sulfate proteoglycan 5b n=1 Tax=Hippocampus comes TaxID=109280 RepID=A0A3Q2YVC0_HIPCM